MRVRAEQESRELLTARKQKLSDLEAQCAEAREERLRLHLKATRGVRCIVSITVLLFFVIIIYGALQPPFPWYVLLIVVLFELGLFIFSVRRWIRTLRQQAEFDSQEREERSKLEAMLNQVREAERKWTPARAELKEAREAVTRAKTEHEEVQRDGATIGSTLKAGIAHFGNLWSNTEGAGQGAALRQPFAWE